MAIAGKVAITPKGDWNNIVTYNKLDLVKYNNSLYIAKKSNQNIIPEDGDIWMLAVKSYDEEEFNKLITDVDGINSNLTDLQYSDVAGGKNIANLKKWVEKNGVNLKISSDEHDFTVKGNHYSLFANPYKFSDNDIPVIISVGNIIVSGGSNFRIDVLNSSGETIYQLTKNTKFIGNASSFRFDFSTSPDSVTLTDFMIEKGNVKTDYEPYIPSVKMLAEGVASQNASLEDYGLLNKCVPFEQGTISESDGSRLASTTRVRTSTFINVKPSDLVSIKINTSKTVGFFNVYFYKDGVYKSYISNNPQVTIPSDINQIQIVVAVNSGTIVPSDVDVSVYFNNAIDEVKNDLDKLNSLPKGSIIQIEADKDDTETTTQKYGWQYLGTSNIQYENGSANLLVTNVYRKNN